MKHRRHNGHTNICRSQKLPKNKNAKTGSGSTAIRLIRGLQNVELDQRKVLKDKSLVIQDRAGRVCEYSMLSEVSTTVGGYLRLWEGWENHTGHTLLFHPENATNEEAFGCLDEKIWFWKLMQEGFNQKWTELWFAADGILSDLKEVENDKARRKKSMPIKIRKFHLVLCWTSIEEDQNMSFPSDRNSYMKKARMNYSVNQCMPLHHIEEIPGGNKSM